MSAKNLCLTYLGGINLFVAELCSGNYKSIKRIIAEPPDAGKSGMGRRIIIVGVQPMAAEETVQAWKNAGSGGSNYNQIARENIYLPDM